MMNITPEIKKSIRKHALDENPKECCGILFQQRENLEVFKCSNYSENPSKHFYIPANDYLKASFCGPLRAIYHSHTSENETFSENDKMNSHNHQITFLLYNTIKDSFFSYDPAKEKTVELNKNFIIGKSDCYTLVKDYYKKLEIILSGENFLGDDWHKKNPHLIQELFNLNETNPSLPIEELNKDAPLKKHDVLVFEFQKGLGPNHVGVYIGDGTLYHHPRNKYPTVEKLGKHHLKKVCKVYRHKELNEQGKS